MFGIRISPYCTRYIYLVIYISLLSDWYWYIFLIYIFTLPLIFLALVIHLGLSRWFSSSFVYFLNSKRKRMSTAMNSSKRASQYTSNVPMAIPVEHRDQSHFEAYFDRSLTFHSKYQVSPFLFIFFFDVLILFFIL